VATEQPKVSEPKPYECRCGHKWYPRWVGERPRVCPKCKSPNWDKPYKFRRTDKSQIDTVERG